MLSEELLKTLCCPACKGDLLHDAKAQTLQCSSCKRVYPIRNGIPILLVDDDKK